MDGYNADFHPITNPYIVGNPIKDRKLFFGREDDFAYLQKKITGDKQGGMVVLCGARRSGKTSILFQILGGRLGQKFVPILIDMQAITVQDDSEFLAEIARKCIDTLSVPELSYELYVAEARVNPHAAFGNLTTRLDRVLAGRKLILMFDEYELFESCIDKKTISVEVFNLLANWMEHKAGVFIIFTGSDKLESRSPSYWEKFLGKAIHRRISFLSESDTLRLIREPVHGVVAYAEEVPDAIYRLSAGQPFYTQVLCQNLVDHLNDKRSYRATPDDLDNVVSEIISNPLPQMIFSWSSIKPIGRLALSIMAELGRTRTASVRAEEIISYAGSQRIGFRIDENALKETLEKLVHDDLITRDEATGGYLFKMDLWKRWIAREHSVWQVVDEIKGESGGTGEGLVRPSAPSVVRVALWGLVAIIVVGASFVFLRTRTGADGLRVGATAVVDSAEATIRTEPPGANLFWGNDFLGRSPVERRRVPVGRRVLRAELAGFREYRDSVEVNTDVPFERTIVLLARTGRVAVRSDPPNAEIVVDGEPTGRRTPSVIENLAANRAHRITLRLAGYADGLYPAVEIFEDSTVTLTHPFSQLAAPLTISTNPESDIFLDGRPAGRSPVTLPSVTYGTHRVEARREGYEPLVESIAVPAEDNLVRRSLVKLAPGWIVFQIEPWADISVDGQLRSSGKPYFPIQIDAGTHEILLRHPSYGEVRRRITVAPGDTTRVIHKFAD